MSTPSKPGGKAGSAQLSSLTNAIEADLAHTAPRQRAVPAPTQLMQFSEGVRQQSEELDKLKGSHAAGFLVQLSQLIDSPYHLLPLEEARVLALMENLRANPLSSPIVVRATADAGVFELLAGRHRVEAFKRLGRAEIQAVASSASDDEAERLVFYDNLFAPNIGDYEKYLGFSKRQQSKGFSQAELAAEAGVSKSLLSFLFSFEKLPEAAQALIAAAPARASATLFQGLSAVSGSHPELVVEAVGRVLAGELAAAKAADWVAKKSAPKTVLPPAKLVFKVGKRPYATLTHQGPRVSVAFQDEESAQVAKGFLEEFLQKQVTAASLKG